VERDGKLHEERVQLARQSGARCCCRSGGHNGTASAELIPLPGRLRSPAAALFDCEVMRAGMQFRGIRAKQ
jgi:hypothetical protein